MQGTLTINIEVEEADFIEHLLNCKFQGLIEDKLLLLFLSFYAMSKGWHIDKLAYYLNLLDIKQHIRNK